MVTDPAHFAKPAVDVEPGGSDPDTTGKALFEFTKPLKVFKGVLQIELHGIWMRGLEPGDLPAISTMREQPLRLAMHLVTRLGGISEDEVLQLELCDFVSLAEEALFLVEHHDNAHAGIPA